MDNIELSFSNQNVDLAYKKSLLYISNTLNAKITEKEPQTLIKAKIGSSFKARALGVRKDTVKNYPVELFVDFINNKIIVKDGMGMAWKVGIGNLINDHMKGIAEVLKNFIEK
jgi:hypothetical protein